jgi:biotin operon repressor
MTRRADRLFQIVQILRGRRLTTAAHLAERLGVSERTVYRDIRDLSLSGVPVEGEAGSGYRLMSGFDLPPLMLTNKESEALIVAIRLLKTWGGITVARAGIGSGKGAGDPARGESSKGGADADLRPGFLHAKPLPQSLRCDSSGDICPAGSGAALP